MGSEYIGNGYGQSRAGGCVGGVGCLADVGCGGNACGAAVCGANVCGVDGCGAAACGINACPLNGCVGDACAANLEKRHGLCKNIWFFWNRRSHQHEMRRCGQWTVLF